ncbi:MAG: YetF domain-containing protein [Chthoniobacteraceae bacterium]
MPNLTIPVFHAILAAAETPAAPAIPSAPGMWTMSLPWWEFIVRGFIVYAFLLILIRITGKRQVGQLAPFDLILLLVLSNAVQNAMNGGDNSVSGGLISAVTLVLLNYLVGMATYRSKLLEGIIEGRPDVLIHNGTLFPAVMKRAKLTHHELNAALRQAGCACVEDVHTAVLENNGALSVVPKSRA